MGIVDLLLNLIGLVLLLAWRTAGRPPLSRAAGTLLSNLKPAETRPGNRWGYLVALGALLVVRPVLYDTVAATLNWTPLLGLGPVALAFRADSFGRLLLHSALSFGWTWLTAFAWLATLVALAALEPGPESWSKFLRGLLGRCGRWPAWLLVILPGLVAGAAWAALTTPLAGLGILPRVPPGPALAAQATLIGGSVWLTLKWLLGGILLLRLLSTYIFFGTQPFWDIVHRVGGLLIRPLAWLPIRFGKLDLTPLVAAALVWAVWWALELGLTRAFARVSL